MSLSPVERVKSSPSPPMSESSYVIPEVDLQVLERLFGDSDMQDIEPDLAQALHTITLPEFGWVSLSA